MARLITRRRFYTTLGATLAGSVAYAYGIEPHWVSVVHRDLPIKHLPAPLDGKLLVQISDLHLGPVSFDYLSDCLARVSELRPDCVVVTGDFMTTHNLEQVPEVARLMRQLPKPPLGVFATLGNHDYGPTFWDWSIANELTRALGEIGLPVLRNELVDVAGLQLIGMDEWWSDAFQPEKALAKYDPTRAALVLSHNPDTLDQYGWGNYQGWVLSGHTHGGQCRPPFHDPPITPVFNKRYTAGEIDLGNGRRVYINRGLGYNRRVRFNARPEITAFTLRLDAASA